jgi:hypothetical protein
MNPLEDSQRQVVLEILETINYKDNLGLICDSRGLTTRRTAAEPRFVISVQFEFAENRL